MKRLKCFADRPRVPAFVITCLLLLIAAGTAFAAGNKRPNIVLILADDLGFSDIGCYGGEIQTPNLDRLAAQGVRFTQFYNASRCCPTRAALLTGLYPHQAGIGHMMQDLGKPGYRGELNDKCVTLAEVLRSSGYHTAMSGKWHVAHIQFTGKAQLNYENNDPFWTNKINWPLQRGFEEFFGTIHGVNSYYDPFSLVRGNEPIHAGSNFYYTDAIADNAVQFIEKFSKEANPFFLYTAFTAPHWPMQAPPDDVRKYKAVFADGWDAMRARRLQRQKELGIMDKDCALSARAPGVPAWEDAPDQEWEIQRMAVYAAMVERMDRGIGRIIEKLEERKIADNTLVIFLSDNGGCAENLQRAWYDVPTKLRDGRPIKIGNNDPSVFAGPEDVWQSVGPAWSNASNTPFRLWKHFEQEGGIATPFIAYWPAMIHGARITSQTAHVIDLMPTLTELARARYPKKISQREITPLEGKNLAGILERNAKPFSRTLFWEHEGNRAVRQGNWKLAAEDEKTWELYNLLSDRSEGKNLAAAYPKLVSQLSKSYDLWAKRSHVLPWKEARKKSGE